MLLEELKRTEKSGLIPWFNDNGVVRMMFMISSNAEFGGSDPMISKGHIDNNETAESAAIREAEEELGLKKSNIKNIKLGWTGAQSGLTESYKMSVFVANIKDPNDFGSFHYETASTVWMTIDEFRKSGRKSQLKIVETCHSHMK